jgi:hypothetical protein
MIDEFTVARHAVPGIKAIGIDGENVLHTYAAYRRDLPLRVRAVSFIALHCLTGSEGPARSWTASSTHFRSRQDAAEDGLGEAVEPEVSGRRARA